MFNKQFVMDENRAYSRPLPPLHPRPLCPESDYVCDEELEHTYEELPYFEYENEDQRPVPKYENEDQHPVPEYENEDQHPVPEYENKDQHLVPEYENEDQHPVPVQAQNT